MPWSIGAGVRRDLAVACAHRPSQAWTLKRGLLLGRVRRKKTAAPGTRCYVVRNSRVTMAFANVLEAFGDCFVRRLVRHRKEG